MIGLCQPGRQQRSPTLDDILDLEDAIKRPQDVPPSVVRDMAWALRIALHSLQLCMDGENVGGGIAQDLSTEFAIMDTNRMTLDDYYDKQNGNHL